MNGNQTEKLLNDALLEAINVRADAVPNQIGEALKAEGLDESAVLDFMFTARKGALKQGLLEWMLNLAMLQTGITVGRKLEKEGS